LASTLLGNTEDQHIIKELDKILTKLEYFDQYFERKTIKIRIGNEDLETDYIQRTIET